jgi:hypothetical protein
MITVAELKKLAPIADVAELRSDTKYVIRLASPDPSMEQLQALKNILENHAPNCMIVTHGTEVFELP